MTRTICAVTGSRADWGLLRPLLDEIVNTSNLQLQLAVTGSHLDTTRGNTITEIEAAGFTIDARVDLHLSSDNAIDITHALGHGVAGFADVLQMLRPDLLLVLGDRYEIMAAVQAALIALVPVAHIAGGDITEGAFDDAIRHAITKMSHLHFVTNVDAQQRLLQMGEDAASVFLTGSPGIDQIITTELLSRDDLSSSLEFPLHQRNLAITFHPATLEGDKHLEQINQLLKALDQLGPDTGLIFTGTNADTGGDTINDLITRYVKTHSNACLHASLGQQRYYSLLSHADVVVGNSSSGLYKAPSLGTPTVNTGDRQKGRPRASSVIDCPVRTGAIVKAINDAYLVNMSEVTSPYGDGHASKRILNVLCGEWSPGKLIHKSFVDRVCEP